MLHGLRSPLAGLRNSLTLGVSLPVLANVIATPSGETGWLLQVTTNQPGGTLYAVLAAQTVPTTQQIKAAQNHVGGTPDSALSGPVTSAGIQIFEGFNANSPFPRYAHAVWERDGVFSNIVTAESFVLAATGAFSRAFSDAFDK